MMKRVADMMTAAAAGALVAATLLRPSAPPGAIVASQASPPVPVTGAAQAPPAPRAEPPPHPDPECEGDRLLMPGFPSPDDLLSPQFLRTLEAMEHSRRIAEEKLQDRSARSLEPGAEPEPVAFTPEFIDRCIEVANDLDPAVARRFEELRKRKPETFERALRLSRHLVFLAVLKERDDELYQLKLQEFKLDAQTRRLAQQVREAQRLGQTAPAARLEEELRSLVKLQLVQSIKARGEYLLKLREQVRAIEAELDRDAVRLSQDVDRRVAELLNPAMPSISNQVRPVPAAAEPAGSRAPTTSRRP
jgi:hypothetical protein